jgi:hypothetical protein
MWGVFSNYMNLTNDDIIAMTPANFSSKTDPKNPVSVYKGASTFTRCVWEIYLGNAVSGKAFILTGGRDRFEKPHFTERGQDLCVGDFWESADRRALTTYTSPIYVDKFILVTMIQSMSNSFFLFPVQFDGSR